MEIWVNFEKSKNMGNVDMGKNLKTLPIMVINILVNILPMPHSLPCSLSPPLPLPLRELRFAREKVPAT